MTVTMFIESVSKSQYGTDGFWVVKGKAPFQSFTLGLDDEEKARELGALVGKQVRITVEPVR